MNANQDPQQSITTSSKQTQFFMTNPYLETKNITKRSKPTPQLYQYNI